MQEETQHKEKMDEDNQQPSIAERLLQQCLIPVPVQPVLPSNNTSPPLATKDNNTLSPKTTSNSVASNWQDNWFKCKICHKIEQLGRLGYHATHVHNIPDISVASKECVSCYIGSNKDIVNNNDTFKVQDPISQIVDFRNIGGNNVTFTDEYGRINGVCYSGNRQPMRSPPWCEGSFPSDLEDVALSPQSSYNNDVTTNGNSLIGVGNENLGRGAGFSNMEDMNSSSCSPPSVGDLTSLNPQDHFDPDFDVVDEMKFIDCLIQTIEPTPDDISEHNDLERNNIPLSHSSMEEGAHDDAVSSEEDTKTTTMNSLPRNDSKIPGPAHLSMETKFIKDTRLHISPHETPSSQHVIRQYPKAGGIIGRPNFGVYPTSTQPCMAIGRPTQSQTQFSPTQSQFKLDHSNTINVSVSNSKIFFQHHQQNNVALPPPMPSFMPLTSNSSSNIHSGHQAPTLFCNTALKPQINAGSSNNDFILSKMSEIPSTGLSQGNCFSFLTYILEFFQRTRRKELNFSAI